MVKIWTLQEGPTRAAEAFGCRARDARRDLP